MLIFENILKLSSKKIKKIKKHQAESTLLLHQILFFFFFWMLLYSYGIIFLLCKVQSSVDSIYLLDKLGNDIKMDNYFKRLVCSKYFHYIFNALYSDCVLDV